MAGFRGKNQPTFNFLAPEANSPPPAAPSAAQAAREPLRETFRTTLRQSVNAPPHTIIPSDPVNEELRAQVNTLRYELETAKREAELAKLEHQQELRDLESRAEADARRAQQAEAAGKTIESKHASLQQELSEVQTRSANERQDLEKRIRASQEKSQQLQEEADELREDLASSQRQSEYKFKQLQDEHKALKETVDEIREELEMKTNALQNAQRKVGQKETEVGELESEVLRLKALAGDAETLAVIKKELSEQVAHIKKLEALTREQNTELKQYRRQQKSIEVVEEEKRDLQMKVKMMDDLRRELAEAQLRKQALEDERDSWTSYLETEAGEDSQFQSPEDLARAFLQERLAKTELLDQLGQIKPEMHVLESTVQTLQDEKAKLQAEIQQLKTSPTPSANPTDSKALARLERQKALATKEVEFLRAQVKAYDDEDREMNPESHNAAQSARVKELEDLVDAYRKEIEAIKKEFDSIEKPVTVTAGQKRPLDTEEADERVGELRRKNRQLQDQTQEMTKRIKLLESEYKAQHSQLKKLKEASRTRVLELKSNPTADAEALKLSTVRTLRASNAELLGQLEGSSPPSSVPTSTLSAAQDEIIELQHTVGEREKRIKRLKQIFSDKSLEFREAVASILGWKLDFMPNGRVRVTSMFYPGDPEEEGSNSIVFDGENGTMKVSGGERSVFAEEIRPELQHWVEEEKQIPCFLAGLTLTFFERQRAMVE